MVNDSLIQCVEKHNPEEVAHALIHAFESKKLEVIVAELQEYIEKYSNKGA